mmetsp:Transcript_18492/g.27540  ORF Transcript_18492/g.27540 Transcript_18492/m.27540 type:complete len:170 (+) Transcript_18492:293-802(+)
MTMAIYSFLKTHTILSRDYYVNQKNRLGRNFGAAEFISHPFFKDLNWLKLKEMQPPFVPRLSSETDTSYFDVDDTVDIDQLLRSFDETTDTAAVASSSSSPPLQLKQHRKPLPPKSKHWNKKFLGFTFKRPVHLSPRTQHHSILDLDFSDSTDRKFSSSYQPSSSDVLL